MVLNPLVSLFGGLVARSGRKRGNRQTDRQTDRRNDRPSTVTLAAYARRGLITLAKCVLNMLLLYMVLVSLTNVASAHSYIATNTNSV